MARLSTYAKDATITGQDKLVGSNYEGLDGQGRPIFTTANYKIEDLLTYFSENIEIGGGNLGGVLTDLNKLKENYTYDEDGNITGLSTAYVGIIANSAVSDYYATASFQTKLETSVVTFDENGLATVAESFANQVFSTTTTDRFAESQYVNNLGASFGTVGADGTISTFSAEYLDQVVLYTDANSATASKVFDLNTALGILDENGNLLYEDVAAYKQNIYTFVDATGGISQAFESVDLALNGDGENPGLTGSVSTLQEVQGDIVTGITSAYGLEVDANGRIASMKLLANNISGTQIVFNADAFLVYTGTEDGEGNPINSAPFKIEGGTVYAKKIAFGDIDGVPDYFLTTVLYADDDSGTNASITKGAGQNYYGIFQSNEPYDSETSDISGVEWLQITGDAGASGESARAIKLVASSYVIPYEPDGTTESETITFTTEVQNTTGALQYRFDIIDSDGNVTLGTASATNTFTLPDEDEPTFNSLTTVKVTLLENSVDVATDSVSIYGVRSGSDAITAFLTNQAHVAPADAEGDNTVLTGSGGSFKVFIGANDVSSQCTFSVNSFDTGLTIAIDANGAYTISGLTIDLGTAVLRAVVPASITKYSEDATFDITYTIAKAKRGLQGVNGTIGVNGARVYNANLFYQSIVTNETAPTFDDSNLDYDFSTASFTGIPSGWGDNPPSTSPGSGTNALYYVAVNIVEGDPSTVTVGNPTTYFNFNGLVTFTTDPDDGEGIITDADGNTFKHTSIDGALIKTGQIQSTNFTFANADGLGDFDPTEDGVTNGTIIDLATGYIKTPKLYLAADGSALFSGILRIGSTDLTADNTLNQNTTKNQVGLDNVDNVSTTTIYQTAATNANTADKTAGAVGGWNVDTYYLYSGTGPQTTNDFDPDGITLANTVDGAAIRAKNFRIDTDGSAYFKGSITGASGSFGGVTIDGSGITSTYFTANASGASLTGSLQVNDADGDTAVLVHDGTFIGAELSGVTSTAPTVANFNITSWDSSKNITSTGETISSLRNYLEDNVIYSAVESITVPAGSFSHSLSTNAITDSIVTLSSDWYGFVRITMGVEFGNSDFTTIYYQREFPNVNIEAGQSATLPAINNFGISLVFNSETTVYVRFFLKRTWKTQLGTASFTSRTFSVASNLQFAGVKGKTEISPNGIQVLNTDDIYFKVDRENFISGNPYVDIAGDTRIDGDLEVTGQINLVGEVNNSDVTVDNLRDRLGELDLITNIGNSTGITVNVRDNLSVVSALTVGGNATIEGNLTVSGTTTTIEATNLAIADNMIYLNDGNATANPDLGIAGNYNDGTYAHTGLFRDADDGRWKFYDSYTPEPDASAFIDTAHTSFNLADVQAGHFYGNLTGNVSGNITTSSITLGGAAVNATAAELNGLHGLTPNRAIVTDASGLLVETIVTATALSYLNGADSNIQDQLDGKQATITGAASTITGSNLTASRALISDASGKVSVSDITSTELSYLNNVTSNIQYQINSIGNEFFPKASFSLDYTFKALYKATGQDSATEVSFHIKGGNGVSNTVKISSSSDGNIFVSVLNSNATANFYYIIAQDTTNPENYVLYARTGSGFAENFTMQFLDSDISDTGFVETLTKPGDTIPTWTTKLHEIRIGGEQNFVNGTLLTAFDNTVGTTAVLGTDAISSDEGHLAYIEHNLVVKGSITADDVQSTSEANSSKKTATKLTHEVATNNRYNLAELGTALTSKRAYLKFIIYGNGHYTEKTYVVHCETLGQWIIKVATEESTGMYDVIFNAFNNENSFELYRHDDTLTDDVSIIFEYMDSGNTLNSNILTLT